MAIDGYIVKGLIKEPGSYTFNNNVSHASC